MRLKVLTFNIHKGLNITSKKLVLDKIKGLLEKVDADIVFLQEVQGEHQVREKKFSDWPKLPHSNYLADGHWPYHFYGKNHCHEHGHHGNAILSKYELLASSNTNISTTKLSNRGLLYSKIILPDSNQSLHLICTHFGLLKKERREQFALLNKFVSDNISAEESLIVAGDFNDWRSRSLSLLSKDLGLVEVFNEEEGSYAKSFPAKFPLLKVDRIYARGLQTAKCEVIKVKGISDHLPLYAEFSALLKLSPTSVDFEDNNL
jgi:endonuclease/exonuclease/phosphatase family metal-dependent hydrolase